MKKIKIVMYVLLIILIIMGVTLMVIFDNMGFDNYDSKVYTSIICAVVIGGLYCIYYYTWLYRAKRASKRMHEEDE